MAPVCSRLGAAKAAAAITFSCLVLAGCGAGSAQPLWRHAPLADDVARTGDGCDARRLLATLIDALNAGAIPAERQETVLSLANAVGAAPCPGEATAEQRRFAALLAAELREGKPLSLLDVLRRLRP